MVSWVQRGGPLAEFADGYRDELACRGFTANSVVTHVVLMGQLSRWMAEVRVAVGALTLARIEEFLDSRRAGGQRRVPTARVLDPLLAHLRAAGVVGPPLPGPATPLGICSRATSATWWKTGAWPLRRSWVMSGLPGGSCPSARRLRETRPAWLACAEAWSPRSCCGSAAGSRSAPRRTGSPACGRCCASCALRAWWPPIWPPRCRRWPDGGIRRCRLCPPGSTSPLWWRAATGRGPPGCGTTRFCCCWPALACARAKWPAWNSAILTGGRACCGCG